MLHIYEKVSCIFLQKNGKLNTSGMREIPDKQPSKRGEKIMKNARNLGIKITAAALSVGVLAGCGASSSSTATSTSGGAESTGSNGDVTTIEVWSNNRHDEAYMTEVIEKFNAENSDVQIKYTIMTDDYWNSIQLAYQANTAPDIAAIAASDGIVLNDYVNGGMFESLTPFINEDAEYQKVNETADHMYEGLNSIGEDIYWVASGVRSGSRIQYNVEMLKNAGYETFPTTFSDMVAAAQAVTDPSSNVYGIATTSSAPFVRWLEGIGEMSGAAHMGYDYTTGTYDFSSWKPVIEEAAKLFTNGSVLPGSETQGVDNGRALFAQGAFAIWGNASQEAGVFTEQFPVSFDWGVAELPTMDGEVKGALSCTPNYGYTMLTSCEDKEAAWKVISYLQGEEVLKGYFEGGYSLPMSSYMADLYDSSKVGRLADFALTDYEDVYPSTPAVTIEGDDYQVTLWNAVMGNVSVDDAIADLNERYNAALERGLANGSCTRVVIADFDPMNPSAGTAEYLTE